MPGLSTNNDDSSEMLSNNASVGSGGDSEQDLTGFDGVGVNDDPPRPVDFGIFSPDFGGGHDARMFLISQFHSNLKRAREGEISQSVRESEQRMHEKNIFENACQQLMRQLEKTNQFDVLFLEMKESGVLQKGFSVDSAEGDKYAGNVSIDQENGMFTLSRKNSFKEVMSNSFSFKLEPKFYQEFQEALQKNSQGAIAPPNSPVAHGFFVRSAGEEARQDKGACLFRQLSDTLVA